MNGDGRRDLVVLAGREAWIWWCVGNAAIESRPPDRTIVLGLAAGLSFSPPEIADIDSDGEWDLIVPGWFFGGLGSTDNRMTPGVIFSFAGNSPVVWAPGISGPASGTSIRLEWGSHPSGNGAIFWFSNNEFTDFKWLDSARVVHPFEGPPILFKPDRYLSYQFLVELNGEPGLECLRATRIISSEKLSYQVFEFKSGGWSAGKDVSTAFGSGPEGFFEFWLRAHGDFLEGGGQELVIGIFETGATQCSMLRYFPETGAYVWNDLNSIAPGTGWLGEVMGGQARSYLGFAETISGPFSWFPLYQPEWSMIGLRAGLYQPEQAAVSPLLPIPEIKRVVVGNFMGAPTADLIWLDQSGVTRLYPDGSSGPVIQGFMGGGGKEMFAVDLDGNGFDEVVVAGEFGVEIRDPSGERAGYPMGLISSVNLGVGAIAPNRVLGSGDFDGDGDPDLLVLDGSIALIKWLENDGDGAWVGVHSVGMAGLSATVQGSSVQWVGPRQVLVSDVDGDGDADVLTCPSALGNRVGLYRKTLFGFVIEPVGPPFSEMDPVPGEMPFMVDAGEGDLVGLLVSQNARFDGLGEPTQGMWALASVGSTVEIGNPSRVAQNKILRFGDFDRDGVGDLLLASSSGSYYDPSLPDSLSFSTGVGGGMFSRLENLASPGRISDLGLADFNGDAVLDVWCSFEDQGKIVWYPNLEVPAVPMFEDWLRIHGVLIGGADDDSDADGRANLIEYAMGTHPLGACDALSSSPPDADHLGMISEASRFGFDPVLVFWRPRGSDLQITPEWSESLMDWNSDGVSFRGVYVDPQLPEWEELSWFVPLQDWDVGSRRRFFRFRVELPGVEE